MDSIPIVKEVIKERLKYLELKEKNKEIKLGSEGDNNFTCEDSGICEFYGWLGDEKYEQEYTDFVIKDFKKKEK